MGNGRSNARNLSSVHSFCHLNTTSRAAVLPGRRDGPGHCDSPTQQLLCAALARVHHDDLREVGIIWHRLVERFHQRKVGARALQRARGHRLHRHAHVRGRAALQIQLHDVLPRLLRLLLGLAGSEIVVIVFVKEWHWIIDGISLFIVMYNFAIVGVPSIFYQKGSQWSWSKVISSPRTSSSRGSSRSCQSIWMILLMLVFWDLFAVMTPIGPLRWLVDLVHEKGTPLPGLLFQANIVDAHTSNAPINNDTSAFPAARAHNGVRPSEDEFFTRLLNVAPPSRSPAKGDDTQQLSQPASFPQFHLLIRAFLQSQHSRFQHRSKEMALSFETRQLVLWRCLYYDVKVVDPSQPYPSVDEVFRSAPTRRADEDHAVSDDKCIKLGLGDFIFYSVLVARRDPRHRCLCAVLPLHPHRPGRNDVPARQVRRIAGIADLHSAQHSRTSAHHRVSCAISCTSHRVSCIKLLNVSFF
ncbi:Presenilin-like protein, partial [Globisporangium splendens]